MSGKFIPCCLLLSFAIICCNLCYSSEIEGFSLPAVQLSEIVNSKFLDDLDVRDIHNKRMQALSAKYELRDVFISGLYVLMVESELHSSLPLITVLEKLPGLADKTITRGIHDFLAGIVSAVLPQIRKLLILLVLLIFGSLSIMTQTTYPSFFSPLFFSPKAKVAPLVLRC